MQEVFATHLNKVGLQFANFPVNLRVRRRSDGDVAMSCTKRKVPSSGEEEAT